MIHLQIIRDRKEMKYKTRQTRMLASTFSGSNAFRQLQLYIIYTTFWPDWTPSTVNGTWSPPGEKTRRQWEARSSGSMKLRCNFLGLGDPKCHTWWTPGPTHHLPSITPVVKQSGGSWSSNAGQTSHLIQIQSAQDLRMGQYDLQNGH